MREAIRNAPPPLLPWQRLLLGLFAGFVAAASFWPAAAALVALVWLCAWPGMQTAGSGPAAPLRRRGMLALGMVACFMVGLAWAHLVLQSRMDDAPLPAWATTGEKTRIVGRAVEASSKAGQRVRLILEDVVPIAEDGAPLPGATPLPGRLLLTWMFPETIPAQGVRLALTTRVKPLTGMDNDFHREADYETYWRQRGVRARAFTAHDWGETRFLSRGDALWEQRLAVREKVFRHLQTAGDSEADNATLSPGGALAAALGMGERYYLDKATMDLLSRTDLRHSVALSGLHVGCVALIAAAAAWLFGAAWPRLYLHLPRPKLRAACIVLLALAYLWLGGASPSLARAVGMALVFAFLLWMGRRAVLLDGLFIAVACICLLDPLAATDLRLILSVACVAGIACFLPFTDGLRRADPDSPLQRRLARRVLVAILGLLAVQLAVQTAAAPLRLWYFNPIALNSLANLFWLPMLSLVVMPLLAVGVGLSATPWSWTATQTAAETSLHAATDVLDAMLAVLTWFDSLGAFPTTATLRPAWPSWIGYWTLAALVVIWLTKRRTRTTSAGTTPGWSMRLLAVVAVLTMTAPPLWEGLRAMRNNAVTLTVADVGQGLAQLVEGPGGVRALVDGGGFRSEFFDTGEHVLAPLLTENRAPRLAAVVMSHGHRDHAKGLRHFLVNFHVDGFFANDWRPWTLPETLDEGQLEALLAQRGVPWRMLVAGEVIPLGDALSLEVVHPAPDFEADGLNEASLALRLVWRGQGLALLPADAEADATTAMAEAARRTPIQAEVLVAPHHGGATSVNEAFFEAVAARLCVASVGYLNQWDHPAPAFREAMAARGIPLYSTGNHGAVRLTWRLGDDGLPGKAHLETARHPPLP